MRFPEDQVNEVSALLTILFYVLLLAEFSSSGIDISFGLNVMRILLFAVGVVSLIGIVGYLMLLNASNS